MLIPQPLLSLAYLAGVRAHMVEPSFLPILILALFPLSAVAGGVLGLRGQDPSRGHHWTVVAIGLIELGWTAVALAIVGFAIALRSG